MRRSGLAPVAAQLAVPVALGLLFGGVLAYQAGSSNNLVHPVPQGAVATPTPSFAKPSTSPRGAVAVPTPSFIKPPASTANDGCGVIAAASPLSARRLATLYELTGGVTPAGPGCA
jgi:hypothetical protein